MDDETLRPVMASGHPRAMTVLRASPWVVILLLIAGVQWYREQVFDTVLFLSFAVLLLMDALKVVNIPFRAPQTSRAVTFTALSLVAAVLVVAPRHTLIVGLTMALIGIVVVPYAWAPRPAASITAPLRRAALGWSVVVVVACGWELISFIWGQIDSASAADHPTISELLDPALDFSLWRMMFVVSWLGIGLLLARPFATRSGD